MKPKLLKEKHQIADKFSMKSISCILCLMKSRAINSFPFFMILMILLISGCMPGISTTAVAPNKIISGSMSSIRSQLTLALSNCTDQATASLYAFDTSGLPKSEPVAVSAIDDNGRYSFDAKSLGIVLNKNTAVQYIIKINDCDKVYFRPVTDYRDQDINAGSSLIGWMANMENAQKRFQDVDKKQLNKFLAKLSGASVSGVYASAVNTTLDNEFYELFGAQLVDLKQVAPVLLQSAKVSSLNELQAGSFSVNAFHWDPDYNIAYLWKRNGVFVSNLPTYTYTPTANDQGSHTIVVYVGKKNNSGNLDSSKPYVLKTHILNVGNTVLADPPTFSLAGSYPNLTPSRRISLDLNTGIGLANCTSFSAIALTEDNLLPPTDPNDFTINCTMPVSQSVSYTLQGLGDGAKTLRMWAMDAAGNVSALPSILSVTLDSQAPSTTLTSLSGGDYLQAGSVRLISWNAADTNFGSGPITIEASSNSGSTWSSIATSIANSESYAWTVPSVASSSYRIRVTSTDLVGTSTVSSSTSDFTIDNSAPSVTLTNLLDGQFLSGGTTQAITWSAADINFGISPVTLSLSSDAGISWTILASNLANSGTYNWNVPAINGANYRIKVSVVDLSGQSNQAEYTSSFSIDNTNPSLTLNGLTGGEFLDGGSVQAITWTATDTNFESNPIKIEYSPDNGANWTTILAATGNSGSYNWSVPSVNSSTNRIRITASDLAGRTTIVESTNSFTIDSTIPLVILTSLNGGQILKGGSSQTINWTATDLNFGSTPISLEYSFNGGSSWTSIASAVSNSGTYTWVTPSINSATCRIRVKAIDQADNQGTVFSTNNFTIDSLAPSLSLTSLTGGELIAGVSSQNITWTATDANFSSAPITIYSSADGGGIWNVLAANISNSESYIWSVPSSLNSISYRIRIEATDQAGNNSVSSSTSNLIIDSTSPVISSFTLNGGAASSATNFLSALVAATDNQSNVTHFRFSASSVYANTKWQPYTNAAITHIVPFVSGTLTVYVWVKDGAGNVSTSSSAVISVAIGQPPAVSFITPTGNALYSTGQTVRVDWSLTSAVGLASTDPIKLQYTTNNGSTFTTISSTLSNGSNSGCSLVAGGSGCFEFSLPSALNGAGFKLRLIATDAAGSVGMSLSSALNFEGLSFYTGSNATLMGGSALSTALTINGQRIAVSSTGDVYAANGCLIYKIDGRTGAINPYLGTGSCTISGTGSVPSTSVSISSGNNFAMDSQDQLYWSESDGTVRRISKSTGNIEVFLGGGANTNPATGTDRLAVSMNVTSMDFDSQDRLVFSSRRLVSSVWALNVYRVNTNGTLEVLAGDGSISNPISGSDAKATGLGGSSIVGSIAVKKSNPDIVFILAGDNKIYSVDTGTSLINHLFTWSTNYPTLKWDPNRNRLIVANPGSLYFIRDDIINSATSIGAVDGGYLLGLAIDAAGGIYYTTNQNQRIFYVAPDNTQSTYAGLAPGWGDGGQAKLAGLGVPANITFDTAGNTYILDGGIKNVRKITPAGVISTIISGGSGLNMISRGVSSQVLYSDGYWARALYNTSMICTYFCGPSTNELGAKSNSGLSASTMSANDGLSYHFGTMSSFDGGNVYVWIKERAGSSMRTHIKKIDSLGNLTNIAGNATLPFTTNQAFTAGQSLTATYAGNQTGNDAFQVTNGVIYFLQNSTIYTALPAGSWVQQSGAGVANSFVVDPGTDNIYYTSGTSLYRMSYTNSGGGTPVLVRNFAGSLSAPVVRAMDYNSAYTVMITDGNSVYKYRNAVSIP